MSETQNILPDDFAGGTFVGRVWRADIGPSVVKVDADGNLIDITKTFPTMSALCKCDNPIQAVADVEGEDIGSLGDFLANMGEGDDDNHLLSPIDLQAVKAAGVTTNISGILEKAVKEANIDYSEDISEIKPASNEANDLKNQLQQKGLWSDYLEAAYGEKAAIFHKCEPMSSVGSNEKAGFIEASNSNNPEAEIVLVTSPKGKIIGATLGNDVNHKDIMAESLFHLDSAKDQNATCAIGPFIRLFDNKFTLQDIKSAEVTLDVKGCDGDDCDVDKTSSMTKISRPPEELVEQMYATHNYPDGAVLFCGAVCSPDCRKQGDGSFSFKEGDVVTISSPKLGTLQNEMKHTNHAKQCDYGIGDLMQNLTDRGLLSFKGKFTSNLTKPNNTDIPFP